MIAAEPLYEAPHAGVFEDMARAPRHAVQVDNAVLDYDPRDPFVSFHQRSERWACIVAHRRAGKTVACVNELVIRALYTRKTDARYAYIAPFYSQAKQVAWTYLKNAAAPFVRSFKDVRESELSVTLFNGATIRLYGADNPDALRGIYLDGVILDEFGDCRPSLWGQVILPTLADRKGWAVFIGTPKGKNHFYDIYERSRVESGWFHLTLKARESGILPPDELQQMRNQMTEAEQEQELECSFTAAVLGTYYSQIIGLMEERGQIRPGFPVYDPAHPVHVAADLGYKDSTALWFWQHAPDGLAVIDYEEHHTRPLAFYMDLLDAKPYDGNYGRIWLPHDARAKTLQTGRSTLEQFMDPPQEDAEQNPLAYKRHPYPVSIAPDLRRQQGIDAVRLVLPHCFMDQQACYAGIEALRAYRRRYDEVLKQFSKEPLHDWASDGADAFRYLALVTRETVVGRRPTVHRTIEGRQSLVMPPDYTLDRLYADRDSRRGFAFERARI